MIKTPSASDEFVLVFFMQIPRNQHCKYSYANMDMSWELLMDSPMNTGVKKDFGSTPTRSLGASSATLARVSLS